MSSPSTRQSETLRPYRSVVRATQRTVRAPSQSASARAASRPHCHVFPSRMQSCEDSGASMPQSRMRLPTISNVSPSTTDARPTYSSACAELAPDQKVATVAAISAATLSTHFLRLAGIGTYSGTGSGRISRLASAPSANIRRATINASPAVPTTAPANRS